MSKENIILVDEWKPEKEDTIVKYDGKLVVVPFDKIFNRESAEVLNVFNILKDSYVTKLDMVTQYINYFIKFYDDDNELLLAYFKLKSLADDKSRQLSMPIYIQFVYNVLLSESMQNKIIKMTEDNYYLDITNKDKSKKYNESLEFTTEHAKILMQISVAMKLMIPVMMHYINKLKYDNDKKGIKKKKNVKFSYPRRIFRFYRGLFEIFCGENGDIDMYNKLWISTCSRINVHHSGNKLTWEQRAIYGTTPSSQTQELFEERIISETMFRYVFEKNIIAFNHVILRHQLNYFTYEEYTLNRIELSSARDVNGLSGVDKLEMNAIKLDESVIILSDVNIKNTIKRIEKRMKYKVPKEELKYYMDHLDIDKFQVQLCQYFYAKMFGGYRDLAFLTKKQYLKLLILLKRRLRMQNMIYLPEILTANVAGRPNTRTIRNDKFLSKIESSDLYMDIINKKYSVLKSVDKDEIIINTLSRLINTKFSIVDFDNPEKLGELIEVNQDMLSDEYLSYVNQL